MSRIIYTVDKSVLSSFTFFKPNQIIEKAAKGSQKAEHEYKYRYPNAKGGWNYVYDNESEKIKELFSNPLEKLSTIFKLAKEKVHTLYVNHGIKASYNATEKDFAKHILEYKLNKERWDKRFEKLETNQKHKNPVKLNGGKTTQRIQKEVKEVTGQDKKEPGEFKPNASLMRKVWAIFNKEKAAESDRKAESENQKKVKETFDAYADVLKNGGRLNISNPKLGNVVFDAGVLGDLTKKNKGGFGIRHLIASRYLKDGMNTDDICALLYLVKDTVETALPPDTEKSKINLKKDGIWVGISKEWNGEKENWIITGFPENDSEGNITKEAADTIKTVNAQYGYALEHSPIREQVGAVIASINTIASADNSVKPKESEIEAHENRSQAMLGNDNAKKDFTEADKELALSHIKNDAVKMLEIPYERKEYEKLFPRGEVKTPFETVKLGEHQFERLAAKDGGTRKNLIGAMYQTLKEPCAVIEDVDKQGREAKLYIKSFIGENKNKFTLAVVVDIDGKPVSVSFGERKEKQIEQKIKMAARFYYVAADSPTIGTGQEPLPNSSNISSIGGSVKLSEGDRVSQNGDTGVITNDFKNGLVFVEFDNGSKGRVKVSTLQKLEPVTNNEQKEPETLEDYNNDSIVNSTNEAVQETVDDVDLNDSHYWDEQRLKSEKKLAESYGYDAFKNGIPRATANDELFNNYLNDIQDNKDTISTDDAIKGVKSVKHQLMAEWLLGWDRANIEAQVGEKDTTALSQAMMGNQNAKKDFIDNGYTETNGGYYNAEKDIAFVPDKQLEDRYNILIHGYDVGTSVHSSVGFDTMEKEALYHKEVYDKDINSLCSKIAELPENEIKKLYERIANRSQKEPDTIINFDIKGFEHVKMNVLYAENILNKLLGDKEAKKERAKQLLSGRNGRLDGATGNQESATEAHENRSRAMMGNQNARKYGISDKSWNYLQRHFEEFENAGRNIITDTGAIDSDFYRAVMTPDTYLTPEQQKEKFAATDEFDAVFAQNGFKKVSEMLIAMYNDYKGATNAENNTGIEPGRLSDSNEPVQSGQLEGNSNKDVHSTENRADRNEPLFSSDESGNGLGRPNSTSDRGRGRITKAQARKIREQCREILKKPDSEITESDKEILSQYVGAGGTDEEDSSNSGVLYEFYTPRNVIKKVWQLVDKYNPNKNKKVIEPSSGIGRFAEDRTENFTLFELEEESARIARILHPDAEVVQGAFQKNFMKQENGRFADKNFDKFDVAVGNPPYGRYEGIYKGRGEGKEFKRYESYFMSRTLDTLKDGGIMAMVVPSSFLNGGSSYGKDLEKIAGKAKLLEAWRLPNGTFDSTDVGTDIVVFQKGDGGKVDDFVNYFANNPDHIAGEVSTRIGRFGEETYIKCKDGETFESAVDNISVDTTDAELLLRETAKITEVKEEKPKKTEAEKHNNRSRAMKGNKNAEGAHEMLNSPDAHIMNVAEFNEKYGKNIDKEDIEIWKATDKYGNIDKSKLTDEQIEYIKNSNHYVFDNGEFVNVVNFASGNIRKKLRELLPNDPQYEYKKKLLEDVMPVERKIGQFLLSPITDWARNYKTKDGLNLIKGFIGWVYNGNGYYSPGDSPVTQEEIPPEISFNDVLAFINREPVRLERGEKEDDKKLNDRLKFKKKEKRQECANRLFNRYLAEGLGLEDQQDLIKAWNDNFNSFRNPDYTKIPVFVDGMSTHKGMKKFTLTPQQLKGVTQLVNKGTGLLAYDVGVGKTATGIVATVNQIQTGRAKRPLICVPRPTYTNWIRTIKQLFPNIKVNELENMSAKHVSKDFVPEEGSISVCTYEGVENISFNDSEMESLKQDIETVNFYDTGDKKESKRQQASRDEKNETQLGEMTKTRDAGVPFSQMGFDHITVDEVHNFRNLFRMPRRLHNKIATEDNEDIEEEDVSKQSNEFGALGTGGEPSNRAKKLFAITQLIQKKNEGRNTFLLSATPFQNSPLEIYSILSFMARDKLKDLGIYSLEQFVGQFCKLQSEYAVKANKIQEKLVMKDFNNLCALQNLITEYIDKVDGEAAGVIRPYKRTHTPELEMTELQKEIMAQCSEYIEAQEELPKDDRDPGYMFRAMNAMRNCALSPALVDVDFFPDPADKPPMSEIVESSPKLKFVCDSVIGQYKQNSKNGQVIYMPSGVEQFPEVRDYLVKNGIPSDAIALMAGGATTDKAMNARQAVIDEFNDVEGKTKVIIGSSTIKEGINLQGNSTVIYNTQLDWNPTDAQQVEGRIWRQGNKQGITHIVYPLMYDSIDSMIYQKYDEKSSRLDALFSYQGDTLNVADINPEELKFGLIKDPEKRADLQVMEFTDKNRNDAKMYSQLIDVLHRQVEIAFQSDDVLAKKANDAMHSWSFSVESHTKRYEEENAEAKKYKKLYDELVKKYKGKEDTFENNGAYYTRRNGKEGYEEALTYIGRSYESHKASANNYKETLTHYNKELKKLTDSRESCRKFLANKGINNEADCDAKIKTYVQFMETAKANIEKAKTMRAQFLEEAIKDNKAKEKVLPSLDEMIKDNISSIMNDLHPMDDEFKARRQDENDRLFKRGKYAETPVSKSLDGLKIEFINYVEKEAAKEFYQKSFDGVADRVQFLSNVRHITDKIEQVQSPVELLSLHNASRPLYRSTNRFSKMSGRIRKLVLKGIK